MHTLVLDNYSTSAAYTYTSTRCAFSGRDKKYKYAKCSACSAVCFRCHRKGHFPRACKEPPGTQDASSTSASAFYPSLCAMQQALECLWAAVTDTMSVESMSTLI